MPFGQFVILALATCLILLGASFMTGLVTGFFMGYLWRG